MNGILAPGDAIRNIFLLWIGAAVSFLSDIVESLPGFWRRGGDEHCRAGGNLATKAVDCVDYSAFLLEFKFINQLDNKI